MTVCGKGDSTLVQAVIIYSTISCTRIFCVIQMENKKMPVVVFFMLSTC